MSYTPWTIRFHHRSGKYIKLSEGNTQARRDGDTYDHGLVFSERSLHLGEVFQLKIEEIEPKWAGSLRLGVTIDSPNCPSMKVARAVTDLFSSEDEKYWILSGAHVHNGGHEEPYGLNMHSLSVNDKVGVQIRPNGNLHFYKNGFDKGVAMKNLPMKKDIYAVFDVYGRTKQVSWDYFGAPTLEHLCREVLTKCLNEEQIEELVLPPRIKQFLKYEID